MIAFKYQGQFTEQQPKKEKKHFALENLTLTLQVFKPPLEPRWYFL